MWTNLANQSSRHVMHRHWRRQCSELSHCMLTVNNIFVNNVCDSSSFVTRFSRKSKLCTLSRSNKLQLIVDVTVGMCIDVCIRELGCSVYVNSCVCEGCWIEVGGSSVAQELHSAASEGRRSQRGRDGATLQVVREEPAACWQVSAVARIQPSLLSDQAWHN